MRFLVIKKASILNERIDAYVRNNGPVKSPPSKLNFYLKSHGTFVFNIPSLKPGEVHEVHRNKKWFTVGKKKVSLTINPGNLVPEMAYNNNYVEGKIKVITAFGTKYVVTSYICSNGKTGSSLNSVW